MLISIGPEVALLPLKPEEHVVIDSMFAAGGDGGDGGWHQHDVSLKYTAHDESVPSFNSSVHELDSWHKVVLSVSPGRRGAHIAWYSYAMQLQYKSHRASH